MHVYLLHTTSSHSLLVLSSPYCELFTLARHRLQHDVDVELNAAPWFPLPPPSAAKDARLLAACRSLIRSRMKIIPPPPPPPPPGFFVTGDTFHFPITVAPWFARLSFLPFVVESTRKFLRERDREMRCWKMSKPFETKHSLWVCVCVLHGCLFTRERIIGTIGELVFDQTLEMRLFVNKKNIHKKLHLFVSLQFPSSS